MHTLIRVGKTIIGIIEQANPIGMMHHASYHHHLVLLKAENHNSDSSAENRCQWDDRLQTSLQGLELPIPTGDHQYKPTIHAGD